MKASVHQRIECYKGWLSWAQENLESQKRKPKPDNNEPSDLPASMRRKFRKY
jgi:hypothetical protein